jgi:hypothetical protein
MPRDHDHLGVRPAVAQLLQRLEAVDARQPHVEQRCIERLAFGDGDGLLPRIHGQDVEALVGQEALQRPAHAGLIVDDQDAFACHYTLLTPECR